MMRSLDRVDLSAFPAERFWANSHPVSETGCWLWMGAVSTGKRGGYACLKFQQVVLYGHQVAYRLAHGDLPPGTEVSHRCEVRSCINPQHLIPETHKENCHRQRRPYRKPVVQSVQLALGQDLATDAASGNLGSGPASGHASAVGGGR